jgi:type VI secretion system protein ImpJ
MLAEAATQGFGGHVGAHHENEAGAVEQGLVGQQSKVGSVEHIRDLVNLQLPGIGLLPLPVAPRQLPYHAGSTYYELDRGSDHWQQLSNSGGFAFHIAGQFPGLNLAFWAIRG